MDFLAIGVAAVAMCAFLIGKHFGRIEGRAARDADLLVISEGNISMRIKRGVTRDDIERFLKALLESEHLKDDRNKDCGSN